jgi:hypothetical protein
MDNKHLRFLTIRAMILVFALISISVAYIAMNNFRLTDNFQNLKIIDFDYEYRDISWTRPPF